MRNFVSEKFKLRWWSNQCSPTHTVVKKLWIPSGLSGLPDNPKKDTTPQLINCSEPSLGADSFIFHKFSSFPAWRMPCISKLYISFTVSLNLAVSFSFLSIISTRSFKSSIYSGFNAVVFKERLLNFYDRNFQRCQAIQTFVDFILGNHNLRVMPLISTEATVWLCCYTRLIHPYTCKINARTRV